MKKIRPRPLYIPVLAGLTLPVSLITRRHTDTGKSRAEDGKTRVMTFNVRQYAADSKSKEHKSAKRFPGAVRTILEQLPDTMGCQEVDRKYAEILNIFLSAEYSCVYADREDGSFRGESVPVFYRRKKYKLLDCGTFWYSETPDVPSKGWDAALNRIATWVKLEDKKTGEKFVHINTHFDHIGETAREKETDMLLSFVSSFDIPCVVTGDFNLYEEDVLYTRLTGGCLRDTKYAAKESMKGCTYNAYKPFNPERSAIDFILITESITAGKYHIVTENEYKSKIMISDHYPVWADIRFEK